MDPIDPIDPIGRLRTRRLARGRALRARFRGIYRGAFEAFWRPLRGVTGAQCTREASKGSRSNASGTPSGSRCEARQPRPRRRMGPVDDWLLNSQVGVYAIEHTSAFSSLSPMPCLCAWDGSRPRDAGQLIRRGGESPGRDWGPVVDAVRIADAERTRHEPDFVDT